MFSCTFARLKTGSRWIDQSMGSKWCLALLEGEDKSKKSPSRGVNIPLTGSGRTPAKSSTPGFERASAVVIRIKVSTPNGFLTLNDFLHPNSAHTLASIKKVNEDLDIIFITSDSGISLGRAVSQLGIHYYAVKPLEYSELHESIMSLNKMKVQQSN